MLLTLLTLTIIFNAIADGLKQNKLQTVTKGILYHIFWSLEKLTFLFLIFICLNFIPINILILIISYALIRFGIFNTIRNIFAGQNVYYIGNTAFQDIILTKIFKTPFLKGLLFWLRWLFMILGFYFIQHYLESL